ncbi:hypothetical protein PR202_ga05641 [Eleusine coracana subsp. coracana]|uniref:Mitochondrial import inner membrane translocase subunit TIM50 n=1 Tax=Eleusine coracana subsp. coracana TaxID=191504 RepID=A0AAV5BTP4_ELECO|nr:hypothetical protein PR202_ga05187 [Eleusine coracana subsp. coracana]GJM89446.1 hypothetical protein PR202_ga05641 [Eleusine coracana subsp. coracana]
MSRALLLLRLLPFSPTAASSRAASSYVSRGVSSGTSRYAASTAAAAGQAEAAAAAQAGAAGPAPAGAAATEPLAGAGEQGASAPPPEVRGRWGLLKFGALAAVSAALGGVGYVSYAYSVDEVEQKTREFRKKMAPTVPQDASGFEKFKAMAMKGTDFTVLLSFVALILSRSRSLEMHCTFLSSPDKHVTNTCLDAPVAAIELYLDARSTIEDHVKGFTEPTSDKLLPDLLPEEKHVFTLVLDLNETLVYSDWQRERGWRTFKRPGVDAFMEHMARCYEVVVFSDQPPMYVDPVIDRLDTKGCVRFRLSRPATKYMDGKHFRVGQHLNATLFLTIPVFDPLLFYQDLSKLNRNPEQVIYVSAHCYDTCLQPENCVQIKPWKLEDGDTQLVDLIPFLEFVAMARPSDTRTVLASYQGCDVAKEFLERSKENHR